MIVDFGLEGRLVLFGVHLVPVEFPKEGMVLDRLDVGGPLFRVDDQETVEQVLEFLREGGQHLASAVDDVLEHGLSVLVEEGSGSTDHFIDNGSQTPVVHGVVVSIVLDDLGGQVLRGPADSVRETVPFDPILREAEVSDFYVPIHSQEHVLWFQVTVHDALFVDGLEGED